MTTAQPLVSVLLTTYCHERYVEEALDSVRAQDHAAVELIITDDCSPDGTGDRIQAWLDRTGYPAVFVRNERNLGICAVRNLALERATGVFVCSLSGDDAYLPDRLRRQADFLFSLGDDVAFIYSDVACVDEAGAPIVPPSFLDRSLGPGAPRPESDVHLRLLAGNFIPAAGVMVRRAAIEAVGGYDEGLAFEDFDMWLRLSSGFGVRHLPGPVTNYRVHAESMSSSSAWVPSMRRDTVRILTRWADTPASLPARLPRRLRHEGLRIALDGELATARAALAAAQLAQPSLVWRSIELALRAPGSLTVARRFREVRRIRRRSLR